MNVGRRIFLLGANGWLGHAIHSALPEATPVPPEAFLAGDLGQLGVALTAEDVIINAAGSKTIETMREANIDLVAKLIALASPYGVRIVHLASAAEYGIPASAHPLEESSEAHPSSEYGRTKLAGTRLLVQSGNACALRVFNIVANPPQPGSPLGDVLSRVRDAIRSGHGPELLAAETCRDWVSRDFVVTSVLAAVKSDLVGVYNICSGLPVSMRQIAQALLDRWGSALPVIDLQQVAANTVIGNPSAWQRATGLSERMTAVAIAQLLVPTQEVVA